MRTQLPYGSWPSPISKDLILEGAASLVDTWQSGDIVWWSELRPEESGRIQIVRRDPEGTTRDLLAEGHSARNRVHEYGGAAWWVHGETVFYTNWEDQRIYRVEAGDPVPITPEPPSPHAWRYADGRVSADGTLLFCVREDHTRSDEAANEIVVMPTDGSADPIVLASGRDFVAAPRLSHDGRHLAWITWDHPNMPWDDTELWTAEVLIDDAGVSLVGAQRMAGGPGESVMEPSWGLDGRLYVISDRTDWWNLYRVVEADELHPAISTQAEIGAPAWQFGNSSYGFTDAGSLVATWSQDGAAVLGRLDKTGTLTVHPLPFLALKSLRLAGDSVTAVATSATEEPKVVQVSIDDPTTVATLRPARDLGLDPAAISLPQQISFASSRNRTAHAIFYPPASAEFAGPDGELPPLIVMSHGGPTSAAQPAFQLTVQYWTSRGFAVADVNYGGSTGYGRAYRKELEGAWGIVDVEDCVAAAEHAVAMGWVDPARLAIRGGSAGGFTTLAALAQTPTFAAGANHFGVSDMAALAEETHKFESRYLDSLVGPYPAAADLYAERSPINHLDGFSAPLITFQGLEDEVVLPNQSERISDALDAKGVPHAYLAFEGEQHGFRQADTIRRVLDAELSFYGQVFGFEPAGVDEPVTLLHSDRLGSA